jgi:hypothetical protein
VKRQQQKYDRTGRGWRERRDGERREKGEVI